MEKINFQNLPSTDTPLNSDNLNLLQDNMEDAIIPIKLVTISDTAPSTATTGDMYYNTTDNKVYTATGTNTWDSGSTPRYDGFYINTSNNTLFYYNGIALIGVGGSQTSINVKNEETTSETDVYSCNYINNMQTNIVTNGSPVKTGRKVDGKDEYIKRGKVILGESTQSGANLRWLINPGLTSVELTKSISVAIISGSNVLDGNMVRTSGLSIGNTSQWAYFDGTNIIFETAGSNRQGQNFCYEIYFTYNS